MTGTREEEQEKEGKKEEKKAEKKSTPPGPLGQSEIEEKFQGFIEGAPKARAYGKKASTLESEDYIALGDRYVSESKTNVNDMISDLAKKLPSTPAGQDLQDTLEDVRKASERMAREALNGDDGEYAVQKKEFEDKCAEAKKQYGALVTALSEQAKTADEKAKDLAADLKLKPGDAAADKAAKDAAAEAKALNDKLEALKKADFEKLQANVYNAQVTEMQRFSDAQQDKDKQRVISGDATGDVAKLGNTALKKWHDVGKQQPVSLEGAKIGGGQVVPSGVYYQKIGTSRFKREPIYDKRTSFEVNGDDKGNYTVRAQIDQSKETVMGVLLSPFRGDREYRRNAWEAHVMMNAGDKKRPLSLVKRGETGGETPEEKVKRCEKYCSVMGAGPHLKRLNSLLELAKDKHSQGFDVPIDFDADVAALRKAPDVDIFALTKFMREMEDYKLKSKVNVGDHQLDQAKAEIQQQKSGNAAYRDKITTGDPDPADAYKLLGAEGDDVSDERKAAIEKYNADLVGKTDEPKTSAEKHIVNEINGIRALLDEMKQGEKDLKQAIEDLKDPTKDETAIDEINERIIKLDEQLTGLREECKGLSKLHEDHAKAIRPLDEKQCSARIKNAYESLGKRLTPGEPSTIESLNPDKLTEKHDKMAQQAQEEVQKAKQRLVADGGPRASHV